MAKQEWTEADAREDMRRAPRRERTLTAQSVRFVPEREEFEIRLDTGLVVLVPVAMVPELKGASITDLADVAIRHDGIEWDRLDVQLNLAGLLIDLLGERELRVELGRRSGGVKSEAKHRASAENGKKGGRPRKTLTTR